MLRAFPCLRRASCLLRLRPPPRQPACPLRRAFLPEPRALPSRPWDCPHPAFSLFRAVLPSPHPAYLYRMLFLCPFAGLSIRCPYSGFLSSQCDCFDFSRKRNCCLRLAVAPNCSEKKARITLDRMSSIILSKRAFRGKHDKFFVESVRVCTFADLPYALQVITGRQQGKRDLAAV